MGVGYGETPSRIPRRWEMPVGAQTQSDAVALAGGVVDFSTHVNF